MSECIGRVGQVVYAEPSLDYPLGVTRVEVLGWPAAMLIELEGHTWIRPGAEITITVREES